MDQESSNITIVIIEDLIVPLKIIFNRKLFKTVVERSIKGLKLMNRSKSRKYMTMPSR